MQNRTADFASDIAAFFAAILLLSLAAIWNGQPFFYPDTPTYVRGAEMGLLKVFGPERIKPWITDAQTAGSGAEPSQDFETVPENNVRQHKPLTSINDKIVLAGRSVYYGLLLYAGYASGGMWLTVLAQALIATYVLHLVLVRLWGLRRQVFIVVTALLAVLTPLGVYTGFLMPDIFAPLSILTFGILAVHWSRLSRLDRWLLGSVLLFGMVAHASHVAIIAFMLLVAVLLRWIFRRWHQLSRTGLLVVFACVCAAVAAEWVFAKAVTVAIGAPPLRLPHPMARLIDLGPGTDFLKKNCPQSSYSACEFVRNYPTKWDDFLFSTDPQKGAFALADAGMKRRLSAEQVPFVLDVLRHDPKGVLLGVSKDIVHQLFNFRVDLWSYGEEGIGKFYSGRVPDSIYAGLLQSRASKPSFMNDVQNITTYGVFAASLIVLSILLVLKKRRAQSQTPDLSASNLAFNNFCWLVIAGVVVNAIICATLASSMDRFQARVVWLVPLMVWGMYKFHMLNIEITNKIPLADAKIRLTPISASAS